MKKMKLPKKKNWKRIIVFSHFYWKRRAFFDQNFRQSEERIIRGPWNVHIQGKKKETKRRIRGEEDEREEKKKRNDKRVVRS